MSWKLQNHLGGFGTVWKNSTFSSAEIGQWLRPQNVGGHGLWDKEQWPRPLMSLAAATGVFLTNFSVFSIFVEWFQKPK